jgi:hypothetical protein
MTLPSKLYLWGFFLVVLRKRVESPSTMGKAQLPLWIGRVPKWVPLREVILTVLARWMPGEAGETVVSLEDFLLGLAFLEGRN